MKVLITGGAGSVGYETIIQLIDKKHDITAIELKNKTTERRFKKIRNKIDIIWGDITDYSLIENLVKDKDVVIHLAAIIPPKSEINKERTRLVNYGGTKNIVDAILKVNKKCFLLFSSSISIYGDRLKNYNIKTSDPLIPLAHDYYAIVKKETEGLIIDSNINYSIFRLTGIMDVPKPDPFMFHMPLDTKLEIATSRDTGRAFVNSLEHLEQLNKNIYDLGGGLYCRTTYKEFLKESLNRYGLNFKYIKQKNFAKSGFHCGYYINGDKLNDIIHFQEDTLESYYKKLDKRTNPFKKLIAKIFSKRIIKKINDSSEFKK